MINLKYAKRFCCDDVSLIENYNDAIADKTEMWQCHHKMECIETGAVVNSSRQDLIDWNIYYDRPADELIFLRESDHKALHGRNITEEQRERQSNALKGKKKPPRSEEHRKHLGEAHKGKEPWNKGKVGVQKHSEETKRKISKSNKGHAVSEETRRKISEAQKGKSRGFHWFTNGVINKMAKECPVGFRPGRIKN